MKNWLRKKIRSFIGMDTVEINLQSLGELSAQRNRILTDKLSDIEKINKEVIDTSNALLNQFNLSIDHYPHERNHSWAVISIQGKPEYVSFIDLSRKDAIEIHKLVKRYERTNRTIDSPFQIFKW